MVYGARWRTQKGWLREGVEGWWRNRSSQSQESLPTYSVPVYAILTQVATRQLSLDCPCRFLKPQSP